MPRLKQLFEKAGCTDVATYINSGNVIFSEDRLASELTSFLETALEKEFGLTLRVLLRDKAAIDGLCHQIPDNWRNDIEQKTDVLFLWAEVNDPSIIDKVKFKPDIENVRYVDGALVWNIARQDANRGSSIKLIQSDLYPFMTIRNINTVRKLQTMMN
ncbi:MAG: hypothetical protein JWM37_457 [Candidatus Saccharibacteria bacterium]|nr:hypothetical protein [Candidatus Saccharibacteria bacterium]